MDRYELSSRQISDFACHLKCEERAQGTIDKYLRDVCTFAGWLDGREVTKEVVIQWKEALLSSGDAPVTVNSKLSAANSLFRSLGWEKCRVRFLKNQRQLFRDNSRELTRAEYGRLLDAARGLGRERFAMLIETMCATGIRVSEVRYITVESAKNGMTENSMKGKIRTLLLPGKLCRKLLKYVRKIELPPGNFSSPEAEAVFPESRSGLK